ncbi:MAG: hydrolase [Methylophilaceae bacterium 17-44-8]|nr:MAG: hydrolase [Methylophilales bacterium 28-44-11]OYZ11266.1 MAG: hydrolase [Methylophilales bacterium 16-45-7]OZA05082.1 MAG: hydrolase [Methylophilaceae bacterium 17-44-8]
MTIPSLARLEACQLVMIDMQTKLSLAMPADAMYAASKQVEILLHSAQLLSVPVMVTEQYPQGLGQTLPNLTALIPHVQVIEKTAFSACAEPKFNAKLSRDKSQMILVGMEAHICVLQTAMDLLANHKQVFVVEDAVISRQSDHKANALARLRQAGCIITNTESVLFEWLGNAQHETFKTVSKLIR